MLYASPVWWGFAGQCERNRLQTLIRRLIHFQYLPEDSSSFEQLCLKADSRLFSAVLTDKGHVLHALLPPVKTSVYSLRPRAHDRVIPPAESLMRRTYITRMIYSSASQTFQCHGPAELFFQCHGPAGIFPLQENRCQIY